eukprot:CAMPEP_0179413120 /NCGR_PEP_ID=MMETSP0799-20121207/4902_1 /TAXON_ID=46947 /ORGANISM="Geminigera cryophila, Strain CCMP2564" /LENGTH=68 /DNA_ID=CAMNT_0021185517 /DNA_START=222 /DNA_END=428 /DNA_ORIENTATION=-
MCHLTLLVGRLAVVGGVEVPVAADSSHVDGTIGALSGVAFNGGGGGLHTTLSRIAGRETGEMTSSANT